MASKEDSDSQSQLKAGHPPAVKAGGMRITQHKPAKEKTPTKKEEEPEDIRPPIFSQPQTAIVMTGTPPKETWETPKESVQSYHNKPLPTHDKHSSQKPMVIQQPRK